MKKQELHDGNLPTVPYPNPESADAMKLVVELAKQEKADIVLGTDPDADRLGLAIPLDKEKTTYRLLTGNQIATLLCDYLMDAAKERLDEKRPIVVKSLVTTDIVATITQAGGGKCKDVLTGFKYIAEQMAELEGPKGDDDYFLFGCEESYGFLTVNQVRDKDAISSALACVEMVSYWAKQGLTLQQRLDAIYEEHGYSTEAVFSKDYEGSAGKEKMASIMASLRKVPVGSQLAGKTISSIVDLQDGKQTDFPPSDVLIIRFETGEKVVVRPSGTEPKIKYYLFFTVPKGKRKEFEASLDQQIKAFKVALP